MSVNFHKIESAFRTDTRNKCSVADDGMVATQSGCATDIGKKILKKKGNAVDAAVASALALGVCEPQASGLGGQTMLIIGDGKKVIAVDGSSRVPSLGHTGSISPEERSVGYRATTVPSTPATLWYVHQSYGSLKWEQVVRPSIELATSGYRISALQESLLKREYELFKKVASHSGIKYFFSDEKPYQKGDLFKQPDLAQVLKLLSQKGIDEFYKGSIAHRIDADMRENGGLLRYEDLAFIPYPIERKPLTTTYRNLKIFSMPPPGAGRTLIYGLNMLEYINREFRFKKKTDLYHVLVKIIRRIFYERENRPYAPEFFPQIVKTSKMLDREYAYKSIRQIIRSIDKNAKALSPAIAEFPGETTHVSVIDKKGMAVSLTQSIERVYGSKAAAEGLGFLYNNYIMDFNFNKPEHPYYLRPNSKPWATVAPSLLYNGDNIWMSIGSPGSERIISSLILFLYRMIDQDFSLDAAMKAPRLHCSVSGKVSLEAGRFPSSFCEYLSKKKYSVDKREDYAFYLGCVQAILKKQSGSGFQGVADVRRDGKAL